MRQDKTGEILHCCPTGMLFAAGNAVLGRKVANITSFTVMLTLWAFACGLFFVFSIIHIELKWQCFSVLFTSLMNRLKKKKKLFWKFRFHLLHSHVVVHQSYILSDSGKCIFFIKGCQCPKVPDLSRHVKEHMLFDEVSCAGKFGKNTWMQTLFLVKQIHKVIKYEFNLIGNRECQKSIHSILHYVFKGFYKYQQMRPHNTSES